jgi:hypothetical protein
MRNHIALNTLFASLALAGGLIGCADDELGESGPGADVAAIDVTFLMPLDSPASVHAGDQVAYGTLLPRSIVDTADTLTVVDEPDALYGALRVVGVRLDSCFIEGGNGLPCDSQVRLVLQPVFQTATGPVARDAAIHAFFAVPLDELTELADDLANARSATTVDESVISRPGVSPIPDAAWALVSEAVGESRLTRITFVAVHASDEAWTFGGFDIDADGLSPVRIPGVPEPIQHLTSVGGVATLDATILPDPVIETTIADFLSGAMRDVLDQVGEDEAVQGLERLLDPAVHDPGTVDCASCHIATPGLRFATRDGEPDRIAAVYDDSRNQRMFGWYGSTPSISLRVEAETQAALSAFLELN